MASETPYNKQYRNYEKPSWSPPEQAFGIVWSILYVFIAIVNIWVIIALVRNAISWQIALPFWLNLHFNFIFTPIQFRLKNNYLACLDIVLVLTTIVWSMLAIWSYSPWPSLLYAPYLLWVLFATILQFSITWLNR